MKFHLNFTIPPFEQKINYAHKFLFVGSCFTENIGEIMQLYKFNVKINPNGVLYNPASMAVALRSYIDNKTIGENELFYANECWNSWEHHSRFSNTDKQSSLTTINNSISSSHDFIKQTDWLFITFGSAFIYKRNDTDELVGNCHKVPQKEFTKQMLSVNEIVADYKILIQQLKALNNNLKIIFTISPVRHIREGIIENNRSKARLIEAVHELIQQNDNSFYFPAYELVIDDLRDYRFYNSDLVHPNEQAISYVFEKLMSTIFDDKTKELFEKIKDIITAKQHRPFNSTTDAYLKFKTAYLDRCSQLQKDNSFLNLKDEIAWFEKDFTEQHH
ncbi:MAG: GSCFA domain-containing protein [Bacteroidota bacterium]|nr:GSCFA domain-containing protein [Bacteroidota bacterium]